MFADNLYDYLQFMLVANCEFNYKYWPFWMCLYIKLYIILIIQFLEIRNGDSDHGLWTSSIFKDVRNLTGYVNQNLCVNIHQWNITKSNALYFTKSASSSLLMLMQQDTDNSNCVLNESYWVTMLQCKWQPAYIYSSSVSELVCLVHKFKRMSLQL